MFELFSIRVRQPQLYKFPLEAVEAKRLWSVSFPKWAGEMIPSRTKSG